MPGSRSPISSMRMVTGYVVVPPVVVPALEMLVTTPSKVWPETASAVMVAFWPSLMLRMSSSSTFRVISR